MDSWQREVEGLRKSREASTIRGMENQEKNGDVSKLQYRFCLEYVKDFNGTRAAIRAGYAESGAHVQASRLLKQPKIQEELQRLIDERSEETKIDAAYVLRQAVKIHERCMQEIRPFTDRKGRQLYSEDGEPLFVFDARGAAKGLELVGKHVGVQAFKEQLGLSGPEGGPVEIRRVIVDPGEQDEQSE